MDLGILKNNIVVSCQSTRFDPTDDRKIMQAFMKSAVLGGAKGLRLANYDDIKFAKENFKDILVIGLTKPEIIPENYKELVYITPSVDDAKSLIEAGADIIAFDGTKRHNYKDILDVIKKSNRLSMADVSTIDEAKEAEKQGVDIISTTLSGYTTYSKSIEGPDFELLENCVKNIQKPIFLEGRIWERSEVKHAFELGAYSVVIGSAITRPWLITERFSKW